MNLRTTTLAALAVSACAAAGALAPLNAAQATSGKTSSETTTTVFDQATATYPVGDPFCAFPVERTFDGKLLTRTTTYDDGTVVVHKWVEGLTYQLVNPANGKTLFSHLGGTEDITTAPDGTVTDEVRGNNINFTVPGSGRLTGYVGHVAVTVLPDGTQTIDISTHNEADSIFTEACAYLA
jgi:hypothetical protein